MGIVLDAIIIGVISLCTYIGYKRGLIKVVVSFLAFFIAIILTLLLYKPVANQIIEKTSIDENIEKSISSKIEDIDYENEDDNLAEFIKSTIDDYKEKSTEYIAESLTVTIIEGITFIGLYIVIRIVLFVLSFIFDFIASLPIIEQFDKTGGFIYGILLGIFVAYIFFAILYFSIPLLENADILEYVNQSHIGKFFYEHNIITNQIVK